MPRAENQYAAFVYYRDLTVSTDRLIAWGLPLSFVVLATLIVAGPAAAF